MKSIIRFLVVSFVSFGLAGIAYGQSADQTTAVQILFDDSGVLMNSEQAYEQKLTVLGHLRSMTRQRRFSQARIDVISTSLGRSVWIGTPLDLKGGPKTDELVHYTASHSTHCNNLPGAFSELQLNIQQLERQGFEYIHVIVFSSLIHTPSPCEPSMQITLPQLPPDAGITDVLTSSNAISSVTFFWVDHNQRRVWGEFLEPVSEQMRQQGGNYGFFDIENSVYELSQGLPGISR